MKKVAFSAFVLSCMFYSLSCNPLRSYQKREGCVEFFERVENQWRYNDSTRLFYWIPDPKASVFMSAGMIFSSYNDYCIKGIPKKSVRKLLGEPSDIVGNPNHHYYYYLNRRCFNKRGWGSNRCNYLVIAFDENDEAVSMRDVEVVNSH